MHINPVTKNCQELVIGSNTILFSFGKPVAAMVERHTVCRIHDNTIKQRNMKHIEAFINRWGFTKDDFVDTTAEELEQLAMGK